MGLTAMNVHVKVESTEEKEKVVRYFEQLAAKLPEDPLQEAIKQIMGSNYVEAAGSGKNYYVNQDSYLTIVSDKVRMDTYEEVASNLSKSVGKPILVAMVYDSDVAILEGFQEGDNILEMVYGIEEKKMLDCGTFFKVFSEQGSKERVDHIWQETDSIFAENIIYEIGEMMNVVLLILPENVEAYKDQFFK